MKKVSLDKIIDVLQTGKNAVEMNEPQRDEKAKQTLTRMLEIAAK